MKTLWRLFLVAFILISSFALPQHEVKAALSYPVLPDGLNYYKTTFPTGLIYSQGWYGTFTYAPKATVLLFDDDYSKDYGIAVFAVPPAPNKQPSGAQGGTSLTAITKQQASDIIQSYNLTASVKPFDAEIQAVMPTEAYFTGVWAGNKLEQKWKYGNAGSRPPPELQTQRQKEYLSAISGKPIKSVDLSKYDPDRFWVGGTGNWSDSNHWSATTGGAPGASVPTNADNVFFDANSFSGAGQVVTVNVNSVCLGMNWTGASNIPRLLIAGFQLNAYGNITTISAMTFNQTGSGYLYLFNSVTHNLTTNGLLWNVYFEPYQGTANLLDDMSIGIGFKYGGSGTLTTNNHTLTFPSFTYNSGDGGGITLNLGSSVVNVTGSAGWSVTGPVTINANTATINIAGTGSGTLGNINYNGATLNFNGTAHTLSGSPTGISALSANSTKTQTLTFAGGSSMAATRFNLSGSSGHQHTLQSSNTTNWGISVSSGNVTADYITISRSTANTSGGQTYYAVGNSINSGNNTGWQFPLTIATSAADNIRYRNSQSYGTLNGSITDLGGVASVTMFFDWGYTAALGNTINLAAATAAPASYSHELAVDSGKTVYFRIRATAGAVSANGTTLSFNSLKESDLYTGLPAFGGAIPLIVLVAALAASGILIWHGAKQRNLSEVGIGLIFIAVLFILYGILVQAINAILTR